MPSFDWDNAHKDAEIAKTPPPLSTPLPAVAEAAKWGKTKRTGEPMLKVRFRVTSGPAKGKVFFHNLSFMQEQPNLMIQSFAHAALLGLSKEKLKNLSDTEQEQTVVGKKVIATLKLKDEFINVEKLESAGQEHAGPPKRDAAE